MANICTTQITKNLVSKLKQFPRKLGTSGVAHYILTIFSLTNIFCLKNCATFKQLWRLYYMSDCKMFYIIEKSNMSSFKICITNLSIINCYEDKAF